MEVKLYERDERAYNYHMVSIYKIYLNLLKFDLFNFTLPYRPKRSLLRKIGVVVVVVGGWGWGGWLSGWHSCYTCHLYSGFVAIS